MIQKLYFYLIRLEVQPQVRKILMPMSQSPLLPEVRHNAMLPWISEKTSPIVDSRPQVLISSATYNDMKIAEIPRYKVDS